MLVQANSLPAILERITKDRLITPELIATEIGVSPMTVYRWKNGQVFPKSKIVVTAITNYINRVMA
jgi:hypothetical protein